MSFLRKNTFPGIPLPNRRSAVADHISINALRLSAFLSPALPGHEGFAGKESGVHWCI